MTRRLRLRTTFWSLSYSSVESTRFSRDWLSFARFKILHCEASLMPSCPLVLLKAPWLSTFRHLNLVKFQKFRFLGDLDLASGATRLSGRIIKTSFTKNVAKRKVFAHLYTGYIEKNRGVYHYHRETITFFLPTKFEAAYCTVLYCNCVRASRIRARILKHFEMTAGLKVWVQGFQICLWIFSIENINVQSFRLVKISFIFSNGIFTEICTQNMYSVRALLYSLTFEKTALFEKSTFQPPVNV